MYILYLYFFRVKRLITFPKIQTQDLVNIKTRRYKFGTKEVLILNINLNYDFFYIKSINLILKIMSEKLDASLI